MSDDEQPKLAVTAGFAPVLVEVPIFDEAELREAEEAYDRLVSASVAARSVTRKLKRRIEAARARWGQKEPTAPPPITVTTPPRLVREGNE